MYPSYVRKGGQTWGSVCTGDDPISLESWSDVKMSDAPDVVTIRPEIGGQEKGFCMHRKDLIAAMEGNVVYKWIPNNPAEPQYGEADRSEPFYKHPMGLWLDAKSLKWIKQTHPRKYSLFQLEYVDERLVGTEFGVSNLHGAMVSVYTLIPLASEASFTDQVRRGYVASYRRTSFERVAKVREEAKRALALASRQRRQRLEQEAKQRQAEFEAKQAPLRRSLSQNQSRSRSRSRSIDRARQNAQVQRRERNRPRRAPRTLINWTKVRRLARNTMLTMKRGRNEFTVRFVRVAQGPTHRIELSVFGRVSFYDYESDNQNWVADDRSKWKLYLGTPTPTPTPIPGPGSLRLQRQIATAAAVAAAQELRHTGRS
jgi:hypothetical protein